MLSDDPGTDNPTQAASLVCWFCDRGLSLDYVLRDGIIRTRDDRRGGPYRLYVCSICNRANRCEKTRKGRWFSSPPSEPNLLDYLLGRVLSPADEFLKAASWFRENEERRRYFFERDGDYRYSSGGWIRRLWRRRRKDEPDRERERERLRERSRPTERERERERDPRRDRERERAQHRAPRPRPPILSPWEILGVDRDASADDVRRAFHRLAVQYHPDKVHHLGEEFQRVANEKFAELKNAYDELLRRAPEQRE